MLGLLALPALSFMFSNYESPNKAVSNSSEKRLLTFMGINGTSETKYNLELQTRFSGKLIYLGTDQGANP